MLAPGLGRTKDCLSSSISSRNSFATRICASPLRSNQPVKLPKPRWRRRSFELLLATARGPLPVYIVITMRTDYLGDCAEFPDFPETLNESQYLVPRLTREQRRQAIVGPLGGTLISSALVERILNDAGDEPNQLPILQHALMRTWSRWRRAWNGSERPIGIEDYESARGFAGALNQHADELLKSDAVRTEPKVVEIVFKRLTALGRGNRERRDPAALSELWALCNAESDEKRRRVNAVIDVFRSGEATFLTPREGMLKPDTYIDITHESLIRNWKILAEQWVWEEESQAKTFIELLDRARGWRAEKGEVLRGLDLSGALVWSASRNRSPKWAEHYAASGAMEEVDAFLSASHQEFEASEQQKQQQRQRELERQQQLREEAEKRARAEHSARLRTRWFAAFLLLLLILALGLAVLAWRATRVARDQQGRAEQAGNQLVVSNKAVENVRGQLLAQNGWTEDRLRLAGTEPQLVNESLAAGEALLKLPGQSANILILYHPKPGEPANALVQNWQLQGYKVQRIPALNDDTADVLWFRGSVPVIDIKRIALTMIRAGLQVRSIQRLEGQGPTKAEVGYDPEFSDFPPWSVEELVPHSSFDERMGSAKAYVRVRFPSDTEVAQVYEYLNSRAIPYKVTLKGSRVSTISTNLTDEDQATRLYEQMHAAGLRGTLMRP